MLCDGLKQSQKVLPDKTISKWNWINIYSTDCIQWELQSNKNTNVNKVRETEDEDEDELLVFIFGDKENLNETWILNRSIYTFESISNEWNEWWKTYLYDW